MFGSRVQGLPNILQSIVLLGAAAICWSIWLKRNDMVFEKTNYVSSVQVIYIAIQWLRTWTVLQKLDSQALVAVATQQLARVAKDCFTQAYGWRSSLRIEGH